MHCSPQCCFCKPAGQTVRNAMSSLQTHSFTFRLCSLMDAGSGDITGGPVSDWPWHLQTLETPESLSEPEVCSDFSDVAASGWCYSDVLHLLVFYQLISRHLLVSHTPAGWFTWLCLLLYVRDVCGLQITEHNAHSLIHGGITLITYFMKLHKSADPWQDVILWMNSRCQWSRTCSQSEPQLKKRCVMKGWFLSPRCPSPLCVYIFSMYLMYIILWSSLSPDWSRSSYDEWY